MPNWCINELTIHGDKHEVKNFLDKILTNGKLDYNKLIPEPKTKEECPPAYLCDCKKEHIQTDDGRDWFNWYHWRPRFWGVKWNAGNFDMELSENKTSATARLCFDSPWSPPVGILEKIFNKIPGKVDLDVLCYGEMDYDFRAKKRIDGVNTFSQEFNYDFIKLEKKDLSHKDLKITKEITKHIWQRTEGPMSGLSYETLKDKGISRKDLELYIKRNSLEECLSFDDDNGELSIPDDKSFEKRFNKEVLRVPGINCPDEKQIEEPEEEMEL